MLNWDLFAGWLSSDRCAKFWQHRVVHCVLNLKKKESRNWFQLVGRFCTDFVKQEIGSFPNLEDFRKERSVLELVKVSLPDLEKR